MNVGLVRVIEDAVRDIDKALADKGPDEQAELIAEIVEGMRGVVPPMQTYWETHGYALPQEAGRELRTIRRALLAYASKLEGESEEQTMERGIAITVSPQISGVSSEITSRTYVDVASMQELDFKMSAATDAINKDSSLSQEEKVAVISALQDVKRAAKAEDASKLSKAMSTALDLVSKSADTAVKVLPVVAQIAGMLSQG